MQLCLDASLTFHHRRIAWLRVLDVVFGLRLRPLSRLQLVHLRLIRRVAVFRSTPAVSAIVVFHHFHILRIADVSIPVSLPVV